MLCFFVIILTDIRIVLGHDMLRERDRILTNWNRISNHHPFALYCIIIVVLLPYLLLYAVTKVDVVVIGSLRSTLA